MLDHGKAVGGGTDLDTQRETLVASLKQLIEEELDVDLRAADIDENAAILDDGLGFDSIVLAEFVALIEKQMGFQFEESDLQTESFESLRTLARIIARRRSDGGAPEVTSG